MESLQLVLFNRTARGNTRESRKATEYLTEVLVQTGDRGPTRVPTPLRTTRVTSTEIVQI